MKVIKKLLSIAFFICVFFGLLLYSSIKNNAQEAAITPTPTPVSRQEYKELYWQFWEGGKNIASKEYYDCEFDYLYDNYSIEYIKKGLAQFIKCGEEGNVLCKLPEGFNQSEKECNHLK